MYENDKRNIINRYEELILSKICEKKIFVLARCVRKVPLLVPEKIYFKPIL